MLILTRKIGETILINDEIDITILSIKGNQIRLGFKAPKNVKIHRKEVQQRIKLETPMVLEKYLRGTDTRGAQFHLN